jgi:hypothetical protein
MLVKTVAVLVTMLAACRPAESPNTMPEGGGGAATGEALSVSVATNSASVGAGEQLVITVTTRNTGSSARTLEFATGCHTDYEFVDGSGQVVSSSEQMCTQALTSRTLAAGESFSDVHRYTRGMAGMPPVPSGRYGVRGVLLLRGGSLRSSTVAVELR